MRNTAVADELHSDVMMDGMLELANQVVDGETYYKDVLPQYSALIDEYLSSGEEIPEEIRKIIETYLEIIG